MLSRIRSGMAALSRSQLLRNQAYIGGKWIKGQQEFPVFNPATGEQIGSVADVGPDEAHAAITAANEALKPWRQLTAQVRRALIEFNTMNIVTSGSTVHLQSLASFYKGTRSLHQYDTGTNLASLYLWRNERPTLRTKRPLSVIN